MAKREIIILAIVSAVLVVCIALITFYGENNISFSNQREVKEFNLSEWEAYQKPILQLVLNKMGFNGIDPDIPLPTVVREGEFSQERFNEYAGYQHDVMYPVFFPDQNIIFVTDRAKLDSLVLLYAYYVQYFYKGLRYESHSRDFIELEAISIQNWFEEIYFD